MAEITAKPAPSRPTPTAGQGTTNATPPPASTPKSKPEKQDDGVLSVKRTSGTDKYIVKTALPGGGYKQTIQSADEIRAAGGIVPTGKTQYIQQYAGSSLYGGEDKAPSKVYGFAQDLVKEQGISDAEARRITELAMREPDAPELSTVPVEVKERIVRDLAPKGKYQLIQGAGITPQIVSGAAVKKLSTLTPGTEEYLDALKSLRLVPKKTPYVSQIIFNKAKAALAPFTTAAGIDVAAALKAKVPRSYLDMYLGKPAVADVLSQLRKQEAVSAAFERDNLLLPSGEWVNLKSWNKTFEGMSEVAAKRYQDVALDPSRGLAAMNRLMEQDYQRALTKRADFEIKHIRLPDGSWVAIDEWNKMPGKYQTIGLRKGLAVMNQAIDKDNQRIGDTEAPKEKKAETPVKRWRNIRTGEKYTDTERIALIQSKPTAQDEIVRTPETLQADVRASSAYTALAGVLRKMEKAGKYESPTPTEYARLSNQEKAAVDMLESYGKSFGRGVLTTLGVAAVGLPLFFVDLAIDPIGTGKGIATGVGSAFLSLTALAGKKLKKGTLSSQEAYQAGQDVVTLGLTALLLKAAFDGIPRGVRTPVESFLKKVHLDERGYIRLPGTPESVVAQIKATRPLTASQESSLLRLLSDIQKAIKERNQSGLYEAGKRLLREAENVKDPVLTNYAKDIVNYPRSYIDKLDAASRTMDVKDVAKKLEQSEAVASKGKAEVKVITAEDIGLSKSQFAEFIRERVLNPDLTVEQFRQSLKSRTQETDWNKVLDDMTERFNQKLKKRAAEKVSSAKDKVAIEEIKAIHTRLKENINKRVSAEEAVRAKRLADARELQRKIAEQSKSKYTAESARKVGDLNKQMREDLQRIRERVRRAEERVVAAESAVEVAQKTGSAVKIAALEAVLTDAEAELRAAQKAETETQTALTEAVKLAQQVAVALRTTPAVDPAYATALETQIAVSTAALQEVKETTVPETVAVTGTAVAPEPAPAPTPQPQPVPQPTPVSEPTPVPGPAKPPPKPRPGEPPRRPVKPEPPPRVPKIRKPPKIPPPVLRLTRGLVSQSIPVGSIAWRQGLFWKYIPPPYNQPKPVTLPKGVIPIGARFTNLRAPTETIQMIGDSGASVPDISIDLGVADIFITDQAQTIQYAGKGRKTNVGVGIPSTTQGMTVGGGGDVKGHAYARKVYPANSISRTDMGKGVPVRGVRKLREGKDRVKIAEDTRKKLDGSYVEPVATPAPKTGRDEFSDLLELTPADRDAIFGTRSRKTTKKPVNRVRMSRKTPKRGRDAPPTTLRGIRK